MMVIALDALAAAVGVMPEVTERILEYGKISLADWDTASTVKRCFLMPSINKRCEQGISCF